MYQKNFNAWNLEKQALERVGHETLAFHEREIWWCSVGVNLGDEQDGKNDLFERPVLVIRKFNQRIVWVLPMTTKEKTGAYYFSLEHHGTVYAAILSQPRLVSVKRFRRFRRKISPAQFEGVRSRLNDLLGK